jgi:hypothetical protein
MSIKIIPMFTMSNSKKINLIYLSFMVLFLAVLLKPLVKLLPEDVRKPLVENARGMIASLSHIRDLPITLIAKTKQLEIPQYELYIDPGELSKLDEYFALNESDYNRKKYYVDGYFIDEHERQYAVKVTYRGDTGDHFRYPKKSLRIVFDKNDLFNGVSTFNLIRPEDRLFIMEYFNNHRARNLELAVPKDWFAYLYINNKDSGVYYAVEQWSEELLIKNSLSDTANLYGEEGLGADNLYSDSSIWQKYIDDGDKDAKNDLNTFLYILNNPSDEYFFQNIESILDIDNFYLWNVQSLLSGSDHADYWHNARLYFDPTLGKFKFIPWDVHAYPFDRYIKDSEIVDPTTANPLVNRLLSDSRYLTARDNVLSQYLNNHSSIAEDLDFYDATYEKVKWAFYKDSLKNYTNKFFDSEILRARHILEHNISFLKERFITEKEREKLDIPTMTTDALHLGEGFDLIEKIGQSMDEFLAENHEFWRGRDGFVHLGPGNIRINKTLIIPRNSRLIIEPGTTLYLGERVSIISYSAVIAQGNSLKKIQFLPMFKTEPWGVFAVIGAQEQSEFKNTVFVHQWPIPDPPLIDEHRLSAGPINGMQFRAMLAINHADVIITDSELSHAFGDDAMNVTHGSFYIENVLFHENSADAFDADWSAGSMIHTKVKNSGNDGIDLGGTKLNVEEVIVKNSGDKGFSVGEYSNIHLENVVIDGALIGIAVKDESLANIFHSVITSVGIGVSLYGKKPIFGSNHAVLIESIIWDIDQKATTYEQGSTIVITNNLIAGDNIDKKSTAPIFINKEYDDYRLLDHTLDNLQVKEIDKTNIGLQIKPKTP